MSREEVLASLDELAPARAGSPAQGLDVAGFRLGMSSDEALAACAAHGPNHTQVFAVVDADGRSFSTQPIRGARPTEASLLAHLRGRPRAPYLIGPYVSAMFCTWARGTAHLGFAASDGGAVSVGFETFSVQLPASDYAAQLVSRYGTPTEQLGPETTNDNGFSATSLKWLAPAGLQDCAPAIRSRNPASAELEFTPLLPPRPGRCANTLIVRLAGTGGSWGAQFNLSNLSNALDRTDQLNARLRKANPSIPAQESLRAKLTESDELACQSMARVGCREGQSTQCPAWLDRVSRLRHINASKAPAASALRRCLLVSPTVESVVACGVTCQAGPDAARASVGAPLRGSEIYRAACANMRRLECGEAFDAHPGQRRCEAALSSNAGRVNAPCVEAAETGADVIHCGASCSNPAAVTAALTESFAGACKNLVRLGCKIGKSARCNDELRGLALMLRRATPNPHECLERARDVPELAAACGFPCN